jgi:hypothetical protein
MVDNERKSVLSHSLYDKLKFVAQILLPGLATLWATIGTIWGLSNTTELVATITAFDTFLGFALQLSSRRYYKNGANFDGDVIVTPEDGGNKVTFAFDKPPEDTVDEPGRHSMEFKINRLSDAGS